MVEDAHQAPRNNIREMSGRGMQMQSSARGSHAELPAAL